MTCATWLSWVKREDEQPERGNRERIGSPGPALTSYVFVSTFAVLPRGACSRRRAVPDWTSLGPWSREGRSRFTSASPASLHLDVRSAASLLALLLSFPLATDWLRSPYAFARTENTEAYLSLCLPFSTFPDLATAAADISELRQGNSSSAKRGIVWDKERERYTIVEGDTLVVE